MLRPITTVTPNAYPYFVLQLEEGSRDFVGLVEVPASPSNVAFIEIPQITGHLQLIIPASSAPGAAEVSVTNAPPEIVKAGGGDFVVIDSLTDPGLYETDKPWSVVMLIFNGAVTKSRGSFRFRPDARR
jgi:hypothetical protein